MNKTCQYCNKEFSTLSNLRVHLKSSKTCISLRNITDELSSKPEEKINNFDCNFCNKGFSRRDALVRHLETCKKKEIKEILQKVTPIIIDSSEELNSIREYLRKLENNYNILKIENENIKRKYNDIKENESEMIIELRIKDEQLKMKDEIINILKNKEK